jgi:hypothetical protein
MTVKKLMMTAALVAFASPALAGSLISTSDCTHSRFYGYSNCTTTWTAVPYLVSDPAQQRLDTVARAKEDAKWEAFCKPTFRTDQYGIRRASYAERGCEFGRSE